MNQSRTSENSDAASRFLAMQRNIAGSDLLKQLQLGNMGSEAVSTPPSSHDFGNASNFSSFGLAGLAAAAGLTGLPMSSGGISPITNSVPTIAALLAASQEKLAADIRQSLNGVDKEIDSKNMQHKKDIFELNDASMSRLTQLRDLNRNMNNFPSQADKEGTDELSTESPKGLLSSSPPNFSSLSSSSSNLPTPLISSNTSRGKYKVQLVLRKALLCKEVLLAWYES